MKFGIDIGHNSPPDTGAVGIKSEDVLTTDVGNRVISKLRVLGHEVISCKPNKSVSVTNSLFQRINTANTNKVEVFVSIHFNAFNGRANGTEVFAASEAGRRIAQPVLNEIVKLGFFNRGVKSGSHLYVLKNTSMPGILIECCFIDSPRDMNIFDSEATANAIVKGLTGQVHNTPVNPVPDEELNTDTTVIRLQKALNQLKINDKNGNPLVEDNIMGPATSSATVNFQNIVELAPTGIADTSTWNEINLILAKRIVRPHHAGGSVVKYIQHRVGAGVDGIYGPQTGAAIRKFQRQNGLLADGIVGRMTWQKLIG
ncbi:N-acetylmuramoyl-L-alanine amidase [Umezakia ovalisporum]|jgi:N-acetylmuramoyl-L-alanine amidase|uniref:N-acetylmuramoyl-L-alanine amidase n=2 Tax=Umezakia ovalisporum TaxID=75695 RepID=A0AA43KFH1_9CYAN|nr:N-acetylmuramoyl-L-alanine amidase [Umezakia ovalisporum]MBI1242316.1 cell wall hydrolase [Nostoc sp. RI_552]MDH6056274.1 N-acetylmuramoyl-L-alanine amidase [Umezakia ovalisporum FSS-43]MDH6064572.1 N-acetylmuramoyl-L-alanine amidase [Umezakia ovalisporum FSS-62]MDH6067770.1 N-acetylmuramoyl-L-alanine amidase [Umezakia ovalisporum APH033B]MDH6070922.1 N-acetylmuramoyl-L-alanine amidase [Umezakia ovalisporum CobakiLakeA]